VLHVYREVVLCDTGWKARRAETPDVALAAPFTTARPREMRGPRTELLGIGEKGLTPRHLSLNIRLQGGGALGSYQAGVYEALASSQYLPDWVAGISIGAINAAIIAGNTPANGVERLRSFWAEITAHTRLWPSALDGALAA
jgi:predicted acylesterase/phospholipase RssA